MKIKVIFLLMTLLLLAYLIAPGPSSINQFQPLPNSAKSTAEGDTIQVPNVSAYFSNYFRSFVISFYRSNHQNLTFLPFPPIKLNYPPEYAFVAIKKHTESTYLEEFVYPLRDSLYVNGMEPFLEDGTVRFLGAVEFGQDGKQFKTKTTLRFYPSSIFWRLLIWIGVNIAVILLFKSCKKIAAYG